MKEGAQSVRHAERAGLTDIDSRAVPSFYRNSPCQGMRNASFKKEPRHLLEQTPGMERRVMRPVRSLGRGFISLPQPFAVDRGGLFAHCYCDVSTTVYP